MTWYTFFVHLRLKFNYFLVPIFLFGIFITKDVSRFFSWPCTTQFIIIHLFLYGGMNALNSYYDRYEKGPIGGLLQPPTIIGHSLFYLAWLWKIIGFILTLLFYPCLITIGSYLLAMIFSVAYSHPLIRLKSKPWTSLIVVGFLQGLGPYSIGYSCTRQPWTSQYFIGIPPVVLNCLGIYPLTQIYQIEQDKQQNDYTLARHLGIQKTFSFAIICFILSASYFILFIIDRWYFIFIIIIYYTWFISQIYRWSSKFSTLSQSENFIILHRLMTLYATGFILFILMHTLLV